MKKTIYDIAKHAGVSIATVSRVINNTGRMSDETRKRILRIMEEFDYLPNMHASALTGKKTNSIGVIVPDVSNPFFGEIVKFIQLFAEEQGYTVIIGSTDYHPEKEANYFSLLKQKSVDGLIMATSVDSDESLERLQEIVDDNVPLAMLTHDRMPFPMDVVTIDDSMGGYIATNHLLELGHKDIVFVTGSQTMTSFRDRIKGARQSLEHNGVEFHESQIIKSHFSIEGAKEDIGQYLETHLPTAIFAVNDVFACATIQAARKRGVKVPEDLSVVGFDNTVLAEVTDPPLTTISQPKADMGKQIVRMLVEAIEGKKTSKSKIILSPELIIRQSTVKPEAQV
ncbi:DNA-binding LacI/PurR family transcriptional regulator [Geomicrobium halophilum]|uniref:DNA-binding LacI/PurR family transcriptional regulator n=1 Tax=Geomicrobium halophilum TaxID=549000 RepID=A0A841PJ57_9BACL|nr:LacI family DNA-binding transcriptional regulator [Geomicrobium halophilum]MBB6448759.1 DNA-binding LacI/PurR family transcriptional regulator [Geomicrobium halophilum]